MVASLFLCWVNSSLRAWSALLLRGLCSTVERCLVYLYAASALLGWRVCSTVGRCLLYFHTGSSAFTRRLVCSMYRVCSAFVRSLRRLLFSWAVWRRLIVTPSHHRLIVPWSHRLTVSSSSHCVSVASSHPLIVSSSHRGHAWWRLFFSRACAASSARAPNRRRRGTRRLCRARQALENRAAGVSTISSSPGIRGPPPGGGSGSLRRTTLPARDWAPQGSPGAG